MLHPIKSSSSLRLHAGTHPLDDVIVWADLHNDVFLLSVWNKVEFYSLLFCKASKHFYVCSTDKLTLKGHFLNTNILILIIN